MMPRAMKRRTIAVALSATVMTACATVGVPMLPAMTAFDRTDCATAPDMALAVDLTPLKDKKQWVVDHDMLADAPCLMQDGQAAPYAVFALPPHGTSRAVEVGSVLEPGRLFSPRVSLLDADGVPVRDFANDKLMFRSSIYSVRFVPAETERYVLVTAEPVMIGKAYDAIRSSIRSTGYAPTPYTYSTWYSGHEVETTHAFSYVGKMRGMVYRLED